MYNINKQIKQHLKLSNDLIIREIIFDLIV